jgi:hypothetical protein
MQDAKNYRLPVVSLLSSIESHTDVASPNVCAKDKRAGGYGMVVNRVSQQQTRVHPPRLQTRAVRPFFRDQLLNAADGYESNSLDARASFGAASFFCLSTGLCRG